MGNIILNKKFGFRALPVIMIMLFTQCSTNELEEPFNCNTSTLVATAEATESNCISFSANIAVTTTGGMTPYSYQLDDGDVQVSNLFENVAPGLYQIKVFDANSCIFIVNQTVKSTVSYLADVEPIIAMNCNISGCHNGSNALPDFRSLATVQAYAADIKSFTQSGFMPRNGSLTQDQIDLIACWVDDGALDN